MKTIYFVSYGVSGTVWLWNCLIELGIRVDGDPLFTFDFDRTIDTTSSRFTRRPGNDHFVTSLPSLAFRSEFVFRSDVFVCMTDHRLRPREGPPGKTILLVRDPRDVLMSMQRWDLARSDGDPDFMAYARTHLSTWIEFHEQALAFPDVGVFRFEDYKLDSKQCLADILDFCELIYEPDQIARAVEASTLEMAKRGEYAYLCSTPVDKRHYPATFNQSGRYQKWRTLAGSDAALEYIAVNANDVMRKLGYFDAAGVYKYPPRESVVPVVRMSPTAEVALSTQRDATGASERLEKALALQRAGAFGEALKEMDLALALYPEDLSLSNLKLDTLFAVIDNEPRYIEAYIGEAIRTFYSCANRDSAVLTTNGPRLMRVLNRVGDKAQLRALLDNWYEYSSATPGDDLRREITALDEVCDDRHPASVDIPQSVPSFSGRRPSYRRSP